MAASEKLLINAFDGIEFGDPGLRPHGLDEATIAEHNISVRTAELLRIAEGREEDYAEERARIQGVLEGIGATHMAEHLYSFTGLLRAEWRDFYLLAGRVRPRPVTLQEWGAYVGGCIESRLGAGQKPRIAHRRECFYESDEAQIWVAEQDIYVIPCGGATRRRALGFGIVALGPEPPVVREVYANDPSPASRHLFTPELWRTEEEIHAGYDVASAVPYLQGKSPQQWYHGV